MKILFLLFLTLLMIGCGRTEESSGPQEALPETLPMLPPDENVPEIPPVTAAIENTEPIPADEPYTGSIFCFTKRPAASASADPEDETVLPSSEPVNTCRALAAVVFDFSELPPWCADNFTNTVIFCPDELPYPDSPQYLRMTADGIVYPAAPADRIDKKGRAL